MAVDMVIMSFVECCGVDIGVSKMSCHTVCLVFGGVVCMVIMLECWEFVWFIWCL